MKLLLIFARLLQVVGMILLVYALYFGMIVESMEYEFMLLGAGGVVFFIGWSIQKAKFGRN